MKKEEAISTIEGYIKVEYPNCKLDNLDAEEFSLGWVVFLKPNRVSLDSLRLGSVIFLNEMPQVAKAASKALKERGLL